MRYTNRSAISTNPNEGAVFYKGVPINVRNLGSDVAFERFSDLIELYRLEGETCPMITKQPLREFWSGSQTEIWRRYAELSAPGKPRTAESADEFIHFARETHTDLILLKPVGGANLNFEIDIMPGAGGSKRKKNLLEMAERQASLNALLFYSLCTASLMTGQPAHALYHQSGKKKNKHAQSGVSMILPVFRANHQRCEYLLSVKRELA